MHKAVLLISDTHFPFHHIDTYDFLFALKQKYKPDRVIWLGDELDYHSISFHSHDPDLFSPSQELEKAIKCIEPFFKLFPVCDLLESNHGSLIYRKQKFHGLPRSVFKSYNEIIGAPIGWVWHSDLTIKLYGGQKLYLHHGRSADVFKLSQAYSMCAAQGHYHEKFNIHYWANPNGLFWGMQCGCLVNDKSLAFAYNNTNLKRPIVGTGLAINGLPVLAPMVLNNKGRWIGKLL